MAVQECGFGHLYDTDQYAACPYCAGGGNRIDFGAAQNPPQNFDTQTGLPLNPGAGYIPPTGMAPFPAGNSYAAPAPAPTPAPAPAPAPAETGKTVGVFQKKMNFEPTVGWLVCIEGPEKGKDFRIYGRNNTIGRSEHSDITLRNDNSISRENHAKLSYDKKHNAFHIVPADGTNPVYLNDEPVYVPKQLVARDIVEIGDYKLLFVPFCDEKFQWKTDDDESGAE